MITKLIPLNLIVSTPIKNDCWFRYLFPISNISTKFNHLQACRNVKTMSSNNVLSCKNQMLSSNTILANKIWPQLPSASTVNLYTGRRSYSDWKDLTGKDKIVFLTDKTIDSHIRSSTSLLIMFYAPWCGHCRSAKPEFAKAGDLLAHELPSAQLAAIDCIPYPSVYEKFEVVGYPTFKYYWKGKLIGEYHHRRRATDFVHFMLREPKTKNDL